MSEETSKKTRRRHSAEFKTEVVRKAMSQKQTLAQVAAEYGIHPIHLTEWKKQAAKSILKGFQQRGGMKNKLEEERQEVGRLARLVAQRDLELAWMQEIIRKAVGVKALAQLVDSTHKVSRVRQCELLGIKRTNTYYIPKKKKAGFPPEKVPRDKPPRDQARQTAQTTLCPRADSRVKTPPFLTAATR